LTRESAAGAKPVNGLLHERQGGEVADGYHLSTRTERTHGAAHNKTCTSAGRRRPSPPGSSKKRTQLGGNPNKTNGFFRPFESAR